MPSTTVFDAQPPAWRDAVLPRGIPRLAVEAAWADFWCRYVGLDGRVVGLRSFGESGDGDALFRHFGITAERVVEEAQALLGAAA
jgi:transketolase